MTTVEGLLMYPIPLFSSPLKKNAMQISYLMKTALFLNPSGLSGISASHCSSPNPIAGLLVV